jgi:hypothetical protein
MVSNGTKEMKSWCIAILVGIFCLSLHASENTISLAGQWRFHLDSSDVGLKEQWQDRTLAEKIKLPGSLTEQGFGERPSAETKWMSGIGAKLLSQPKYAPYLQSKENFKTPFWLTPERHYVGAAWYQRDIKIPAGWKNKCVVLKLERPHWETTVWLDDKKIGTQNGLGMANEYDFGTSLTAGKHRLTIRVDNRAVIPVGLDAHSISDQTQTDWNGIVGKIELSAASPIWLDDVQIFPNVAEKKIRVRATLRNVTGKKVKGKISFAVEGRRDLYVNFNADSGASPIEEEIDLGPNVKLWDEFSPALYRLKINVSGMAGNQSFEENQFVTFGLREIGISGTQFTLNGRPIFLRGTLECCIFPITGYPPTDVGSWKRILRIARAHGLNHIRFHSWCPPEAAFVAADEMGFYYQVEASSWGTFGDGSPLDKWIYDESERMVKAYGNHPSFLLMVPSNEPGGKNRERFLADWVAHWTKKDPRRKYTAGSGWPMVSENNFHITQRPRLHATSELEKPPQTKSDYREFISAQSVPVISHEIGQWCAYPNFDEISKYKGALKPGNLEIFRDFLDRAGMENQARDFVRASGKFQAQLYKAEIEEALRTPGMAGFQLLDLHDFPGQGTAPVGVLDAVWEEEGYIKPEEYRRFCAETVPLARLAKRVFTSDEIFTAQIEVAHFGAAEIKNTKPIWRIRDVDGKIIGRGELNLKTIPTGGQTQLGEISFPLSALKNAAKLNLEIALDKTPFANDWDFWVYPAKISPCQPSIHVAEDFDDATRSILNSSGNVLLLPNPHRIQSDVLGAFRPIFWNRVTFVNQCERTVGLLCDPKHPALRDFPTDFHSNWQWWDLAQNSQPIILDAFPKSLQPIVQPIDDWNECRKLGLIFEAKVLNGKVLFCAIDLQNDLENRPVARQLRFSLENYVAGKSFSPSVTVAPEQIESLLRKSSAMESLGARVISADSQVWCNQAANILDGDPQTIWHTPWKDVPPQFPHDVVIEFKMPVRVSGLRCLPRQDGQNGWIKSYIVQVSDDEKIWREIVRGELAQSAEEKTIRFAQPETFRYLKFIAASAQRGEAFASLAELSVIETEK